ncbi:hypothetical protein Btru_065020 [Bulinus truncatus]|nr:hypothetical protein Btru_065020 [Bulinus truncatus]
MAITWCLHGNHLVPPWPSPGASMAITWCLLDHHMVPPWPFHDGSMAITWCLLDHHMVPPWPSPGAFLTITWCLHGQHLVPPWPSPYASTPITWCLHGHFMMPPYSSPDASMAITWCLHGYFMMPPWSSLDASMVITCCLYGHHLCILIEFNFKFIYFDLLVFEARKFAVNNECFFLETSTALSVNIDELLIGILCSIKKQLTPLPHTEQRDDSHFKSSSTERRPRSPKRALSAIGNFLKQACRRDSRRRDVTPILQLV